MLILKDPANIECGHTACRACLAHGKCVDCTAVLPQPTSSIAINYELQRVAAQLLRRCPHKECTDIAARSLNLAAMKTHLTAACLFAPVECVACATRVPRSEFNQHLSNECKQRKIKCRWCDEYFTADAMAAHELTSARDVVFLPPPPDSQKRQRTEDAASSSSPPQIKQEEDSSSSSSSQRRGCCNMAVCGAECVDPQTNKPVMLNHKQVARHVSFFCNTKTYHCDLCCKFTPTQSSNPHRGADCQAHTFRGVDAFSAHARENIGRHDLMQIYTARVLCDLVLPQPRPVPSTLVGSNLPARTNQAIDTTMSLASLRCPWVTDTRCGATIHSKFTRLVFVRVAKSSILELQAYSTKPVPKEEQVLRVAITFPAGSGEQGAILAQVTVPGPGERPALIWSGTWEHLHPWMDDGSNYRIRIADLTGLALPASVSSQPAVPAHTHVLSSFASSLLTPRKRSYDSAATPAAAAYSKK